MNAKLIAKDETTNFIFKVEIDEKAYSVQVWLNSKGKFIDNSITFPNGDELEQEGEQGEIREKVLDYLDKNWESLTK